MTILVCCMSVSFCELRGGVKFCPPCETENSERLTCILECPTQWDVMIWYGYFTSLIWNFECMVKVAKTKSVVNFLVALVLLCWVITIYDSDFHFLATSHMGLESCVLYTVLFLTWVLFFEQWKNCGTTIGLIKKWDTDVKLK